MLIRCEIKASNTVFFGGERVAIEFSNSDPAETSNSHLIRGGGPAIRSYRHLSLGELAHDLRNNYWALPMQIRALILYGTDVPENSSTVLFEPFQGGAVPADRTSWGELKALFR